MADIKTRDAVKGTIKTIDKAAIATERMKSAYAKTKDKAEQGYYADESSATEYAADRLSYGADRIKDEGIHQFNKQGQKAVKETRENIGKANVDGIDYADKAAFNWISVIRLPEFITKKDFEWAVETASEKKKLDCSSAEFLTVDEGLCVQIMHIGAFDDEPQTVALMDEYIAQNGYENDITESRLHHEIYLSDARKVAPEKWKTVIRHPIKRSRQQS